jgi:subtilase family serine protease
MNLRPPPFGGLLASLVFALSASVIAEPFRVFDPPAPGHARPPLWVKVDGVNKPGSIISVSAPPYTPQQVQLAYGFNALYSAGTTGEGQTIALIDAYDDTESIQSDLNAFDLEFGLAATTVKIIYAQGSQPVANSGWQLEESLDVEWAHAIAPGAKIMLVEASDNSTANLIAAVQVAVSNGATIVSMSWGGNEFSTETTTDNVLKAAGVTYVASAGDSGAGIEWPASSHHVVGVGGTSLVLNSAGDYASETAWSDSGGGISVFEPQPTWQNHWFQTDWTPANRGVPDVSYLADPNYGVYVVNQGVWYEVGGTSVGAPQWSALFALANQGRTQGLSNYANQAVYTIANAGGTTSYGGSTINPYYFHDVTSGSDGNSQDNGAYIGYDLVTGLGSPVASNLVPALTSWSLTPAVPDFGLAVSPASRSVLPGGANSYVVNVFPSNGYSGTVDFSVTGLPTGASGVFAPTSVSGSGPTTLSVQTSSSTPAGTNKFTITGKDSTGSPTHTINATLIVTNLPTIILVSSITYSNSGVNNTNINMQVAIVSGSGSPVGNANVAVTLDLKSSAFATASAITGPGGHAHFIFSNAPPGTYSTIVNSITATGLTWNGKYPANSFTDKY